MYTFDYGASILLKNEISVSFFSAILHYNVIEIVLIIFSLIMIDVKVRVNIEAMMMVT